MSEQEPIFAFYGEYEYQDEGDTYMSTCWTCSFASSYKEAYDEADKDTNGAHFCYEIGSWFANLDNAQRFIDLCAAHVGDELLGEWLDEYAIDAPQ